MNAGRQKVEDEGQCRVCGLPADVCDAAHLWDRGTRGGGFDDPDLIVPLCATFKGGDGCHDDYDGHRLDLRPYVTAEEQAAMVLAAGSIERARTRLMGGSAAKPKPPSEYGSLA